MHLSRLCYRCMWAYVLKEYWYIAVSNYECAFIIENYLCVFICIWCLFSCVWYTSCQGVYGEGGWGQPCSCFTLEKITLIKHIWSSLLGQIYFVTYIVQFLQKINTNNSRHKVLYFNKTHFKGNHKTTLLHHSTMNELHLHNVATTYSIYVGGVTVSVPSEVSHQ